MKKICVIALLCGFIRADLPIDTSEILQDSQITNYTLEITQDGEVIKRFVGDEIVEMSNDLSADLDATKSAKPNLSESKTDKYPHSHIKEWDKSKIIYEQIVDEVQILR